MVVGNLIFIILNFMNNILVDGKKCEELSPKIMILSKLVRRYGYFQLIVVVGNATQIRILT